MLDSAIPQIFLPDSATGAGVTQLRLGRSRGCSLVLPGKLGVSGTVNTRDTPSEIPLPKSIRRSALTFGAVLLLGPWVLPYVSGFLTMIVIVSALPLGGGAVLLCAIGERTFWRRYSRNELRFVFTPALLALAFYGGISLTFLVDCMLEGYPPPQFPF